MTIRPLDSCSSTYGDFDAPSFRYDSGIQPLKVKHIVNHGSSESTEEFARFAALLVQEHLHKHHSHKHNKHKHHEHKHHEHGHKDKKKHHHSGSKGHDYHEPARKRRKYDYSPTSVAAPDYTDCNPKSSPGR